MKLEDLIGEHELSGVDFGSREDLREDYAGTPNAMWFVLDGKTYCVIENPSDGYRSSMRDIEESDRPVANTFAPVKVLARMCDKYGSYSDGCDVLELIDVINGKRILAAGTDNVGDYYPSFVADFMPESMACNAGSK